MRHILDRWEKINILKNNSEILGACFLHDYDIFKTLDTFRNMAHKKGQKRNKGQRNGKVISF